MRAPSANHTVLARLKAGLCCIFPSFTPGTDAHSYGLKRPTKNNTTLTAKNPQIIEIHTPLDNGFWKENKIIIKSLNFYRWCYRCACEFGFKNMHIYICVCVCFFVCECMRACMSYVCMRICICVYVYVYVCVYAFLIYAPMRIFMYMLMCVRVCVCIYTCKCVLWYTFMCKYVVIRLFSKLF